MTPVEALERIVYLLDRQRAEGYRVRAFLKAAETVRAVPPAELAERARTGRLTELDGIGDVTARVITEALAGATPSYLDKLGPETELGLTEQGGALRRALRGDCHVHSSWSDGGASVEAMARAARALGHEYLVQTDHSPRLTVAHGLDTDRLLAQLDEIAALNERFAEEAAGGTAPPFRVLTGLEVDILENGDLDAEPGLLERLDLVVASVHSKLRMDRQAMTDRMLLAVADPRVDVLGHCTGRIVVGRGRPPSQFDADLVFAACARFDTAVEINCRPERLDPPRPLLRRALELGCRFTISTDAHAPGQLEWQPYGCDRAAECAVPAERVVNALGADELVAWTASHGAAA